MDFCEILYWRLSLKSSKILKMQLKNAQISGTLHEDLSHISLLLATLNQHNSIFFIFFKNIL
jgi:hypothetical protein